MLDQQYLAIRTIAELFQWAILVELILESLSLQEYIEALFLLLSASEVKKACSVGVHIDLYRVVKSPFALANFNFLRLCQTNVTLRKRVLHRAWFVSRVPEESDFLSVDDVGVATKLAHFCLQVAVEITVAVSSVGILGILVLTVAAAALRVSLGT